MMGVAEWTYVLFVAIALLLIAMSSGGGGSDD